MTTIAANLQSVRARIETACVSAGREIGSASLLAVSKTWPASSVRQAIAAGQISFGESYVQEALAKCDELAGDATLPALVWHFIGPLQSNKTRPVAEHFDWVHSIDRLKIAERLSEQRPSGKAPLQVCLQVNVSGERSKSGCTPEQALALVRQIGRLPHLKLRGLMAIPEPTDDVGLQRAQFARVRHLFESINATTDLSLDTLSMGMSHDLEAAIIEGSTLVRIGTAIFGERNHA